MKTYISNRSRAGVNQGPCGIFGAIFGGDDLETIRLDIKCSSIGAYQPREYLFPSHDPGKSRSFGLGRRTCGERRSIQIRALVVTETPSREGEWCRKSDSPNRDVYAMLGHVDEGELHHLRYLGLVETQSSHGRYTATMLKGLRGATLSYIRFTKRKNITPRRTIFNTTSMMARPHSGCQAML